MHPAKVTLTVAQGNLDEKAFAFEEPTRCILGRAADCAIRVPADFANADVSRHHCLFDIDPPLVRVRDLGSRNGTFVNGANIGQRPKYLPPDKADFVVFEDHELQEGDEIQVGHTVLRVGVGVSDDLPQPTHIL